MLRGEGARLVSSAPCWLRHLASGFPGTGGGHPRGRGTGITPSSWVVWQMDDPSVGPKIPQALEKILQLKESRQEEMNSQQGEHAVVS